MMKVEDVHGSSHALVGFQQSLWIEIHDVDIHTDQREE